MPSERRNFTLVFIHKHTRKQHVDDPSFSPIDFVEGSEIDVINSLHSIEAVKRNAFFSQIVAYARIQGTTTETLVLLMERYGNGRERILTTPFKWFMNCTFATSLDHS
jgi:hypothetical protein